MVLKQLTATTFPAILYALAKLDTWHPEMVTAICDRAVETRLPSRVTPQGAVNVVQAFGMFGWRHDALMHAVEGVLLASGTDRLLTSFTVSELSGLLHAYAALGLSGSPVVSATCAELSRPPRAGSITALQLPVVLTALGGLGYRDLPTCTTCAHAL